MPQIREVSFRSLRTPEDMLELNLYLRKITKTVNSGIPVVEESPRASERSRFIKVGGGISEGPPKGRARMFRQIPTIPTDATYGGRPKTQVFNGKEWRDIA